MGVRARSLGFSAKILYVNIQPMSIPATQNSASKLPRYGYIKFSAQKPPSTDK